MRLGKALGCLSPACLKSLPTYLLHSLVQGLAQRLLAEAVASHLYVVLEVAERGEQRD
jgi:hypothetical protein